MLTLLCLALLTQTPPDGGLPADATPLTVFRSREDLPKDVAARVPERFNFRREMLAGGGGPIVEPEKVERRGGATFVYVTAPAPKRECRCSGVHLPDQLVIPEPVLSPPASQRVLYRLPRVAGPVYLIEVPAPPPEPCPPCLAP